MPRNYNLVVIDLDALISCNRHVEDHGCENTIHEGTCGNTCVMGDLTEIVESIDEREAWVLFVPNSKCVPRLLEFIERYVDVYEYAPEVQPLIKLKNLISGKKMKLYKPDNKGNHLRKVVENFLNDCPEKRSDNSCETIEERIDCIISRASTPYAPRRLYILFCSKRGCADIRQQHAKSISGLKYYCDPCPLACSQDVGVLVRVLFIYLSK